MTILMSVEIHPLCDHKTFDPKCPWCADMHRVAREFRMLANSHTGTKLTFYSDDQEVPVVNDKSLKGTTP